MITIPPMCYSVPLIVFHHSLDTNYHHVSLFTNFLQTATTPHRHRIAFHRLHADKHNTSPSPHHASPTSRRQPHAASWFCATQITYHHLFFKTLLKAEPARVSRLASGFLFEWEDGSMSAVRLQPRCSHAQQDGLTHLMARTVAGVGAAQNAHNGLMSLFETCDLPPVITRVVSDQMTHMVLPSTWLRLLRAYLVRCSLSFGAHIQSARAFWSFFFFATEHTKARCARSRPRCSADCIH